MRKILGLMVIGLLCSVPAANATGITVTGNTSFTVNWLYTGTNPDLSAKATFEITNWLGSSFTLTIKDIQNTTPTSPNINARLTSLGFGITPNATSVAGIVNGTYFEVGQSNFPGFQQVDICAHSGNNCAGGANGGLDQGSSATDTVSMVINGGFSNGVVFDPLAVKFQTDLDSYEFGACTPGTPCVPTVPEPASMLLLGSGLLSAGWFGRRRKK